MKTLKLCLSGGLGVALGLVGTSAPAGSVSYNINVNTSSVQGQTGYIDLQLDPSTASGTPLAYATMQNFATDGTLLPNSSDPNTYPSGDVSGSLPGTLSFDNGTQFNDYTEKIDFGSFISLNVILSGAGVGAPSGNGDGDTFVLDFVDSAFNGALLSDQANGEGYSFVAGLIFINGDGTTTPVAGPGPTGTPNALSPAVVGISPVPEISGWAAALLGGAMISVFGLRGKLA